MKPICSELSYVLDCVCSALEYEDICQQNALEFYQSAHTKMQLVINSSTLTPAEDPLVMETCKLLLATYTKRLKVGLLSDTDFFFPTKNVLLFSLFAVLFFVVLKKSTGRKTTIICWQRTFQHICSKQNFMYFVSLSHTHSHLGSARQFKLCTSLAAPGAPISEKGHPPKLETEPLNPNLVL